MTSVPAFQQLQQDDEANRKESASASQLKSLLGVKVNSDQGQETKSGWGGPAPGAVSKGTAKPLKEIMQQEEQQSKTSPDSARPAPNSWAAKIGTGGGAAPAPAQAPSSGSSSQPSRSSHQPTSPRLQPALSIQTMTKPKELPVIRDMSPQMVEWCITTMKGIIGSDFDGTGLLEILVSLESPVDIREIISETLGSTPQVSGMTSRFIFFSIYLLTLHL